MGNNLFAMSGLIVVFLIIGIVLGGDSERKRTLKRIERLKKRKPPPSLTAEMSLRRKTNDKKGITYYLSKPLPDFKNLGEQLERAGVTITAKQYLLRRLMYCALILFVVSFIFQKKLTIGVLAGVVFGIFFPLKMLRWKIEKQGKAFLRLFPDAIDLIVRGLRSGLPVSESLVLVSTEVPDPVGTVFSNISNKMKLGVTLEKALQETARELDLTEFNFFTTSIILQRETGGNLSEILNNLSEVLRNRFIMRMKIKAMSSEARASSYIIGALPFVVILAVSVLSPDYMTPLYNDYRGNICAMVAAGMMISGMWVMNRMTKFEI
jgi:tight adherence protein B